MVKRTQYLIDDLNVSPSNIMLITFTNKAANEIKERISKVSKDADSMWIGTFHKICTRIIRKFGSKLNIQNFTILDTKDAKKIISNLITDTYGMEYNKYLVNEFQSKISMYKNNLVNPTKVTAQNKESQLFCNVYQSYQNICWKKKMFDFDDLIIYAILLLSSYKDVAEWIHSHIKYIVVDEAQDTGASQFTLINLMAGNNNVMLVGDVNQSIYAFRNAKPQYLEHFANSHSNTIKLLLEQNYRSTKTIIQAANAVIAKNNFGTKLNMFCDNKQGNPIMTLAAPNSSMEAKWIVSEIATSDRPLSDFAIIYRTNAQSRVIEEELTKSGIAYTVFGSQSFYTRKEVRDLIAYCKAVINPNDTNAFIRVLSCTKGIGKVTQDIIIKTAERTNADYHQTLQSIVDTDSIKNYKVKHRLAVLSNILNSQYNSCSDIVSDVLLLTDYRRDIASVESEETMEKLAIIDEFRDMIESLEENNKKESMSEIIDQLSLLSDAKGAEKDKLNAVKLMTAHSSKGLEFPCVFIIGTEEGSFPYKKAIESGEVEAIEEERRLFYVAMTRAKEQLYITRAMQKGCDIINTIKPSRFIEEIPKHLKELAI